MDKMRVNQRVALQILQLAAQYHTSESAEQIAKRYIAIAKSAQLRFSQIEQAVQEARAEEPAIEPLDKRPLAVIEKENREREYREAVARERAAREQYAYSGRVDARPMRAGPGYIDLTIPARVDEDW